VTRSVAEIDRGLALVEYRMRLKGLTAAEYTRLHERYAELEAEKLAAQKEPPVPTRTADTQNPAPLDSGTGGISKPGAVPYSRDGRYAVANAENAICEAMASLPQDSSAWRLMHAAHKAAEQARIRVEGVR
jgi:hypothetical protein